MPSLPSSEGCRGKTEYERKCGASTKKQRGSNHHCTQTFRWQRRSQWTASAEHGFGTYLLRNGWFWTPWILPPLSLSALCQPGLSYKKASLKETVYPQPGL